MARYLALNKIAGLACCPHPQYNRIPLTGISCDTKDGMLRGCVLNDVRSGHIGVSRAHVCDNSASECSERICAMGKRLLPLHDSTLGSNRQQCTRDIDFKKSLKFAYRSFRYLRRGFYTNLAMNTN